jgi:ATP-dependent protease Clp ATPase subunit
MAMGIVYIDEVDKLRAGSGGSASSTPKARSPRSRHRAQQPGIDFDTTNFLFICGGTFVGLEDIIARGSDGVGSGSVSWLKIARWLLMG